jgi:hypothetical protein
VQTSQIGNAAELIGKRLAAGEMVPDAEMAQLQGAAAALKLDDKVYDLGVWRTRAGINRETQSWLPAKYDTEIYRLRALGDKASPAEQVRLKQLEEIAPARKAEIAKNPAMFLAANGAPPPELDMADPSSWQQRRSWAAGASQALSQPVPLLSPAEAAPMIAIVEQGNKAQRIELAHKLVSAGGALPNVLTQIAGRSPGFGAAVRLAALPDGEHLMEQALAGPDALKAAPDLLKPEKPVDGSPQGPTFRQIFDRETARAMALLPSQMRSDLFYNSINVYAARAGQEGWTFLHPGEASHSIDLALGGRRTSGGQAGGIKRDGPNVIVLPQGMTGGEFDYRIARAPDASWQAAAVNGPAWAGKRAMTAAEARSMVPVMVRDGQYALRHGKNSYVTTRDGHRFVFDVRKLPIDQMSASDDRVYLPRLPAH